MTAHGLTLLRNIRNIEREMLLSCFTVGKIQFRSKSRGVDFCLLSLWLFCSDHQQAAIFTPVGAGKLQCNPANVHSFVYAVWSFHRSLSPSSRFGKWLSVLKAFNPSDFLMSHLEHSWLEKFNVCCFWIVTNVVLSAEKRSAIIFGKAIRPKIFEKWRNSRILKFTRTDKCF